MSCDRGETQTDLSLAKFTHMVAGGLLRQRS
jgi:hypothetical protein